MRTIRLGRWITVVALLAAAVLALAPARAAAADLRNGDSVVIGPEVTIDDDLYVFGSTITILGTVNGDVIAAGNTLTIGGTVNGDVMAAGNTVAVTGRVTHSVRAAGGAVTVTGTVDGDVVAAGGAVAVGPGGRVGRDLWVGGAATVYAPVGRNVLAGGETLTFAAPVGGDVRARVGRLTLAEGASIGGSLSYTSDLDAVVAPGASVAGRTERTPVDHAADRPAPSPAEPFVGWLRGFVGLAALGLCFVLGFPRYSAGTTGALRASPGTSLALGAALLFGVPVAALLVGVVGLIVGGWWLGLAVLLGYAFALPLAYVAAANAAGRWLVERAGRTDLHPAWVLLLGLALFGAAAVLPSVGGFFVLGAVLFGLGALGHAAARARGLAEGGAGQAGPAADPGAAPRGAGPTVGPQPQPS